MIHKSAVINDDAKIASTASIGAGTIIGENVVIGENVKILGNAYLEHCEIGDNTVIAPFASIGSAPQDLGYKGEATKSVIGKNCIIKEYVTVNRASGEGNITKVGDNCLLMASSHVAHNCVVEDNVIMANLATLGGHTVVEFGAFIGGMSVFHQNVRIGAMSIVSGFSASRMDILPYCKADGRPAITHGINAIGLKRKGVTQEERNELKAAIKIITSGKYLMKDALNVVEETVPQNKYVKHLVEFVRNSKRGICISRSEAIEL